MEFNKDLEALCCKATSVTDREMVAKIHDI